MKKIIILSITLFLACSICRAHDKAKALHYLELYAKCDGKQLSSSLFMMKPDVLLSKIKNGENIFILDVRTKAEEKIVGLHLPDTLSVPMSQVFSEKTLSLLPTDKTIVVLCLKGVRSSLITMGLRDVGFDNAFSLKEGMAGLVGILTPTKAN